MVVIIVWLPLTGTLLEPGRGDPDNPVGFSDILIGYKPSTPTEGLSLRALEFDWGEKQVRVQIEGSQELVDWLASEHGLEDGMGKLTASRRRGILARLGKTEMRIIDRWSV